MRGPLWEILLSCLLAMIVFSVASKCVMVSAGDDARPVYATKKRGIGGKASASKKVRTLRCSIPEKAAAP